MKYPIEIHIPSLLKLFFVPDISNYYSPAYSWFVNQAGHALIGLVLAMGLVAGVYYASPLSLSMSWLLTIFVGFILYALKEYSDYLTVTRKDSNVPAALKFDRHEILFDVVTDWFFVNIGVFTGAAISAAFLTYHGAGFYSGFIFAGVAVALVGFWWFGSHYLKNKLLWQYSNLPYLIDIAHCLPERVNPLVEHLQIQLSSSPESTLYVGSFHDVHECLCGISRRRMVHTSNQYRRVRYWQAQELIEACENPERSVAANPSWRLLEADVHVVWLDDQTLPPLSDGLLAILSKSVWLVGTHNAELPPGWAQLSIETRVGIPKLS
jgi:hypothetical protein